MTVREVLTHATEYLGEKGVESPRLDAELLLGRALGLSRIALYTEHDRPLTGPELAESRALVRRRGGREPLAYVLGEWGFRRLTLKTDARALVPRPETEAVVERCLELLRGLAEPEVLDVGTGSGAIALAIADEHPGARVTALDNSADALALARENLATTGLGERVRLVEHDLRSGLGHDRFDLVVSNPPYVSAEELETLESEVREWEPRGALVEEGHTEAVARAARATLRPGGSLVLEIATPRAEAVSLSLRELGYTDVRISPDLTGRDRVVEGRRFRP